MKQKTFIENVRDFLIVLILAVALLYGVWIWLNQQSDATTYVQPQATSVTTNLATGTPSPPTMVPSQGESVVEQNPTAMATNTPVPTATATSTPVPTATATPELTAGAVHGQLWHSCNGVLGCNTLDGVNVIVRQQNRQSVCDQATVDGWFACHGINPLYPFNIEFVFDGVEYYSDEMQLEVVYTNETATTMTLELGELTIDRGRIVPLEDYLSQN